MSKIPWLSLANQGFFTHVNIEQQNKKPQNEEVVKLLRIAASGPEGPTPRRDCGLRM
jgi:hypothetical protein